MWALRPPGGGSEFGFTLRVLEADELDAEEPDERHPVVPPRDPFRRPISPEPARQRMTPMAAPAAISQPVPMPRRSSTNAASAIADRHEVTAAPPMASWTRHDAEQPDGGRVDAVEEGPGSAEPRSRSRIGMLTATATKAGRKMPTVAAAAPSGPPTR